MLAIAVLVVALSPHSALVEKPDHEMCAPVVVAKLNAAVVPVYVAPPPVVPVPVYVISQASVRGFRLFSPVLRQGRFSSGSSCASGSCR